MARRLERTNKGDEMDDLSKLAKKYGADKWGKHNYTPVYYDLFKDRRESVKKVLEIGAGEGASLFMWRDFFPNAHIYAGEIEYSRLLIEKRIEVIKCNQTKEEDLISLINLTGPDIDLFVDDGSHKPEDQLFTALAIMPLLNKDAIYIIEDVVDTKVIAIALMKGLHGYYINIKHCGERYDDSLIIIGKHK